MSAKRTAKSGGEIGERQGGLDADAFMLFLGGEGGPFVGIGHSTFTADKEIEK